MYRSDRGKRQCTSKRPLTVELLQSRQLLTSVGWDGPGQGSAELSYYIASAAPNLSLAETQAAIETALDAWAGAADLTFTPTDQPGQNDSLDISFTPLDGSGGTLARAYFPDDVNRSRIAGDIQFDSAEAWEVGNELGSQAFDLVYVAVHEIGHALGLDHAHHSDSILAPTVSPMDAFTDLSEHDIEEIQELYAAPEIPTQPADDDMEADNHPPTQDNTLEPTEPTTPTEPIPTADPPGSGNDDSPNRTDDGHRGRHWLHRWFRFRNWSLNYNLMQSPTNMQPTTPPTNTQSTLTTRVVTIVIHRPVAFRFVVPLSNEALSSSSHELWLPRVTGQLDRSSAMDALIEPTQVTSDDDHSLFDKEVDDTQTQRLRPERQFNLRRFASQGRRR